MSDVMLFGVLRMPFNLAMGGHLAQHQFYQRAQECADRLEKAEAALASATDAKELQLKLVAIISSATSLGEQRVYDLADSIMRTLPVVAPHEEPLTSQWPEVPTVEMENAFFEQLPCYTRDEVDHPNDTGRMKLNLVDDYFNKCYAAMRTVAIAAFPPPEEHQEPKGNRT